MSSTQLRRPTLAELEDDYAEACRERRAALDACTCSDDDGYSDDCMIGYWADRRLATARAIDSLEDDLAAAVRLLADNGRLVTVDGVTTLD